MTNEKRTDMTTHHNEGAPKRIVLRHLSGSKANQVEEFPLNHFKELVFGRGPAATVKYNADQDDLVSRQHAKLVQYPTDPTQFTLVDNNSRNGTFVNKQRIIGSAKIVPGDVVQFGAGGPEFQFDLEPRPEDLMRPTRLAPAHGEAADPNLPAPTRVGDAGMMAAPPFTAGTPSAAGKTTVMRMIAQINHSARKQMIAGGVALLVLIALVAGIASHQRKELGEKLKNDIADTKKDLNNITNNAPFTPTTIAKAYTNSAVYIEVGWKLIHTPTGSQVYHEFKPFKNKGKIQYAPAYLELPDGSVEPWLTLENERGKNEAIGGLHSGSGFTVTNDGFILTNRHVAASWFTKYHFPHNVGLLFRLGAKGPQFKSIIEGSPSWVPAETRWWGRAPLSGKILEGRNDYLDVTFAKNELRMPARLVRVSNRHDVAMIKVDTPQSVTKAELHDNYDAIRPGDAVTVLGYPGVSPNVVVGTRSNDPFNRNYQTRSVPDPTVTNGLIAKVLRGEQAPTGRDRYDYQSEFGDSYQLTVNATGSGNSGGPVFDERGRVIAIFYAGRIGQDGTHISFAVPIRFGIELLGTNPVLR